MFDTEEFARNLKRAGVSFDVEVHPSVVQESPYNYVYVFLTSRKFDAPHIIVSDADEYGDDGILVGIHFEAHDEDAVPTTLPTGAHALMWTLDAIRTCRGHL